MIHTYAPSPTNNQYWIHSLPPKPPPVPHSMLGPSLLTISLRWALRGPACSMARALGPAGLLPPHQRARGGQEGGHNDTTQQRVYSCHASGGRGRGAKSGSKEWEREWRHGGRMRPPAHPGLPRFLQQPWLPCPPPCWPGRELRDGAHLQSQQVSKIRSDTRGAVKLAPSLGSL